MKNPRIAAAIARAGITQQELAKRTQLSAVYLCRLFSLELVPTRDTAEAIAIALNCRTEDLFTAISTRKATNTIRARAIRQAAKAKEVAHV